MTKFTFWPNSIKGLNKEVTVLAHTYTQALHKVMKEIYLHKNHIDNYSISETINNWENS